VAELVARLEAAVPTARHCPRCARRLKANRRAPRRLVNLVGQVELVRRRCRYTNCGVKDVPLDAALGLEPRTQHTLGVRERGCWLVTELRYAKTAELLAELRGIRVSGTELHAWIAEEGGRIEAAQAALFETGRAVPAARRPETVWVSATGAFVHDRRIGTEFELKVGLVFEGTSRVARSRRALIGRELAAETGDWHTFAERSVERCAVVGVFDPRADPLVSDGAGRSAGSASATFPTPSRSSTGTISSNGSASGSAPAARPCSTTPSPSPRPVT
jgi:hypothetical protein